MTNLRILQSAFIPSLNKVVNLNDEIEIKNPKLAERLVEMGIADELNEKKSPSKQSKKAPKEVEKDEPVVEVHE